MSEESRDEEFESLVLKKVTSSFDLFLDEEFKGSLSKFINRFIAADSDLFSDIGTYQDNFSEKLSSKYYSVNLFNIYLSSNFVPNIHLIFSMQYEEQYPLEDADTNNPEYYCLVYDITRHGDGEWDINQNEERFRGNLSEYITSDEDFFVIKEMLKNPANFDIFYNKVLKTSTILWDKESDDDED
jgi:hypothetical protein